MIATTLLAVAAVATPTPTPVPPRPSLTALPRQPGERGAAPTTSLADIAKRIKLRLPPGHDHRITNDDLAKLTAGVELTTAAPSSETATDDLDLGSSGRDKARDEKKDYWQNRYWDALRRLDDLQERERYLQGEVSRLEREFYARDDPAQRDMVIKPAWDRALIDLRTVQDELVEAREAPGDVLEDARRDGALPGWFREEPPAAVAAPSPGDDQGAP